MFVYFPHTINLHTWNNLTDSTVHIIKTQSLMKVSCNRRCKICYRSLSNITRIVILSMFYTTKINIISGETIHLKVEYKGVGFDQRVCNLAAVQPSCLFPSNYCHFKQTHSYYLIK